MPWHTLIDLIKPHYLRASKKGGRPAYPLATILRIHLLQQVCSISDPVMEDALIEVAIMCRFAGIDLISDRIPDETTILSFMHLPEKHDLGQQIFMAVKGHLSASGITMGQGTIVDATLIAAWWIPLSWSCVMRSCKHVSPRRQCLCLSLSLQALNAGSSSLGWYFWAAMHLTLKIRSGPRRTTKKQSIAPVFCGLLFGNANSKVNRLCICIQSSI